MAKKQFQMLRAQNVNATQQYTVGLLHTCKKVSLFQYTSAVLTATNKTIYWR